MRTVFQYGESEGEKIPESLLMVKPLRHFIHKKNEYRSKDYERATRSRKATIRYSVADLPVSEIREVGNFEFTLANI